MMIYDVEGRWKKDTTSGSAIVEQVPECKPWRRSRTPVLEVSAQKMFSIIAKRAFTVAATAGGSRCWYHCKGYCQVPCGIYDDLEESLK